MPLPWRSITKSRAHYCHHCVTSESQSKAAGTAMPVAGHSHSVAAASVWVSPSAPGWSVQPDRFWSYSWETGPCCQPAAAGSAAKASVFRTWYSPGAWSAGRHKGQSQCLSLPPAFLLLRYWYMWINKPRRSPLKSAILKCSYDSKYEEDCHGGRQANQKAKEWTSYIMIYQKMQLKNKKRREKEPSFG